MLLEALGLKAVPRAGWVRSGVVNPESVAAHSWGVSWLVLALLPAELDRGRALAYAVIHDLPEVRCGDITPADGLSREAKRKLEHDAAEALFKDRADLRSLWESYERQADPEARFVRQLDRLDMALQAAWYRDLQGIDLEEFLDSAASVISHPVLVEILQALRQ